VFLSSPVKRRYKCKNCGAVGPVQPDGSKPSFCDSCGASLQRPSLFSDGISTRKIAGVMLLVILVLAVGLGYLYYYEGYRISVGTPLIITHSSPVGPFFVAHQITFQATVTGTNLNSVILTYRLLQWIPSAGAFILGGWVSAPMFIATTDTTLYSYTMPASEVSGSTVQYQISASDSSGNTVRTSTYELAVGDFNWDSAQTSEVVAVRTVTSQVSLTLNQIDGFTDNVTIKIPNSPPAGVSITPVQSQVSPPNAVVLQITSTSDSQLVQRYLVEIDAVYSPVSLSSIQVIRRTNLVLTVTDFGLTVSPTYAKVIRPSSSVNATASYVVTLSAHSGFTVPAGFVTTVTGLPSGTSWTLQMVSYAIDSSGNAQTTYKLIITVRSTATVALSQFDFKISASIQGTTVSHNVSGLQLDIVSS